MFTGKDDSITKHVYRIGSNKYVLGVYTMNTAKFYPCDVNGKKLSAATLDLS